MDFVLLRLTLLSVVFLDTYRPIEDGIPGAIP
jgi:hypothetical protein